MDTGKSHHPGDQPTENKVTLPLYSFLPYTCLNGQYSIWRPLNVSIHLGSIHLLFYQKSLVFYLCVGKKTYQAWLSILWANISPKIAGLVPYPEREFQQFPLESVDCQFMKVLVHEYLPPKRKIITLTLNKYSTFYKSFMLMMACQERFVPLL